MQDWPVSRLKHLPGIDASKAKRGLVMAAATVVTMACLTLPLFPQVGAIHAVAGASGAMFAPAVAAITLGIDGPKAFAARITKADVRPL